MRYHRTLTIRTKEMFAALVGRGNQVCQSTDELMVRTGEPSWTVTNAWRAVVS